MNQFPDRRFSRIQAVFLDMDGTIYHGSRIYPTTLPFLNFLKRQGIPAVFCTNNSSRSKEDYVKHLAGFGIAAEERDFYTSTDFLVDTLRTEYPQIHKLLVLGVPSMLTELRGYGYMTVDAEPEAVVVSFDKTLTYERLCRAAWYVKCGLPAFSTHPDLFCPTDKPEVLVDCGAISCCVELAAGRKLRQLGKPDGGFLRHAAARLGVPPENALMIGDRLATDIAAGVNAGTLTCRITGPGADLSSTADVTPDWECRDLGELHQLWEN